MADSYKSGFLRDDDGALVVAGPGGALVGPDPSRHALPSTWDKGACFQVYDDPEHYAHADARAALDKAITDLGINSISLWREYRQATPTANAISAGAYTASDAALTSIVAYAKSKGLKVMLRTVITVGDGSWRGTILPATPATWWTAYQAILVANGTLAQTLGIDMMDVGSELKAMTLPANGQEAAWRTAIAAVRGVYTGELTYGASWGQASTDEFRVVAFWDALDSIGIDAYFPMQESAAAITEDELVRRWGFYKQPVAGRNNSYIDEIERVAVQYGRPVRFHEIGYATRVGTLVSPATTGGTHDQSLVPTAFSAALRAWAKARKPWFRGMYIWDWYAMEPDGGAALTAGGTDHVIAGKPQAATIKSWFTHTAKQPPLAADLSDVPGIIGSWDPADCLGVAPAGGAVARAPDASGFGHDLLQATGSKQPLLILDSRNGQPVFRFDGAGDTLRAVFYARQPWTMFIPAIWRAAYAVDSTLFDSAANFKGGLFRKGATALEAYAGTSLAYASATPETWALYTVHFNGASSKLRINGVDVASGNAGAGTGAVNDMGLALGADGAGNASAAVDIGHCVMLSGIPTASVRAWVESYLRSKLRTP